MLAAAGCGGAGKSIGKKIVRGGPSGRAGGRLPTAIEAITPDHRIVAAESDPFALAFTPTLRSTEMKALLLTGTTMVGLLAAANLVPAMA